MFDSVIYVLLAKNEKQKKTCFMDVCTFEYGNITTVLRDKVPSMVVIYI